MINIDEEKEEETNMIGGADNQIGAAAVKTENLSSSSGFYISHPGILAGNFKMFSRGLLAGCETD